MVTLTLHDLHAARGAVFSSLNDFELVRHYGDPSAEYEAVHQSAALFDLSFRGRLGISGADRVRYLHGQLTQDVKSLTVGRGAYSALTDARARLVSDLHLHALPEEFWLDFEPGLTEAVTQRFRRFLVAEKVQIQDLGPTISLLSVQGPRAAPALGAVLPDVVLPAEPCDHIPINHPSLGVARLVRLARTGGEGFEVLVETPRLRNWFERLEQGVRAQGGRPAGWDAFELAQLEAGLPRFGVDMDETNLLPETGLEQMAVSYTKGCYIGQEVIARVRTYGQVARALRGLRLPSDPRPLPLRGDQLQWEGKPVGALTRAAWSPRLNTTIALGYVARGANTPGTGLILQTAAGAVPALIVDLPFRD